MPRAHRAVRLAGLEVRFKWVSAGPEDEERT
jgi:hypothetical protein